VSLPVPPLTKVSPSGGVSRASMVSSPSPPASSSIPGPPVTLSLPGPPLSRSVATESYFVGHHHGSLRAWAEAGEVGRPPAWPESDAEKPKGAEEDPAVGRGMEDLDWKLNKYGELLPEIMDRMERELAGDALTLWSGFAAFCAESMGVAAEKILVATLQEGPGEEAVRRVEGLKARAERLGLEPDKESVEEIRKPLAEAWSVVEERDV
jgi:hypothetical protein